jgi:hypothetical protein
VHQLLDIVCNAARDSNLHIADDYAVSLHNLLTILRLASL